MTTSYMIGLSLNGLLFLAWAITMFRTLFAQRRRAVERTGKTLPGPVDALHEWGHWWRDPDQQGPRRLLLGLALLMFASTILMWVWGPMIH